MAYFKHFPKMYYDVRGSETVAQRDVVTNILARVLVKSHAVSYTHLRAHET